jgi:hypothetical protein
MQHNVVEGEPGIFPQPVAQILRAIGGLFNRKRRREPNEPTAQAEQPPEPSPDETAE